MPINKFGEHFHKRKIKHVLIKIRNGVFFETCLNIPCTNSITIYTFPLSSGTIVHYQKTHSEGLLQVLVNDKEVDLNGLTLKRGDVIRVGKGGDKECFIIITVKCPLILE